MQLGHSGLSLPIPLPMWYYNHCFRFSDNTLHPAFTRTVFPASPSSPKTTTATARVTNTGECTAVTSTAKSDATWRSESKPKKNSFSIEAILDIESNPSTDRGNINESKVAVSIAERRRHRLFENPHPYIAASYTTNHHPFANTQLPVCQDSKNVSLEEGVSSRVAGVVHDWKRQHHHHSHHSQQQPPQHIEPHTSVTLPRAPSKNSPSTKGGKRVRTIFTPEQLEQLETEFSRQQYMVGTERYYLAGKLALSEVQVKVWFQNRRIKMRKQQQEAIKEHFAQCRYMNASESEEEDDEEEENDDAEEERTPPTQQQQQQQQQSPRTQHRNRPNDTAENQRSSD